MVFCLVYDTADYDNVVFIKGYLMKEKYLAYMRHWFQLLMPSFCVISVATLIAISLWSFRFNDMSWLYHARYGTCQNLLGYFGSTVAAVMVYLFGSMAYAVPFVFLYSIVFVSGYKKVDQELDRIIGVIGCFFIACMLCTYHQVGYDFYSPCGGVLGSYGISWLRSFDVVTKSIVLYTLMIVSMILSLRFMHLSFTHFLVRCFSSVWSYAMQVDNLPARFVRFVAFLIAKICLIFAQALVKSYRILSGYMIKKSAASIVQIEREDIMVDREIDMLLQSLYSVNQQSLDNQPVLNQVEIKPEPQLIAVQPVEQVVVAHQQQKTVVQKKYVLPDIEKMLSQNSYRQPSQEDDQTLVEHAAILEEKLRLFGIKGKVVRVHPGPVITLFEYRPDVRIKLSKILGLEDDLAMALQALSIRIIAPIPGKDVVGFEVSNKQRKAVLLSDIFHSTAWTKFKGSLPLILGEDTAGSHVVVDLATMPHVLIAGSTGSGKSVALNCMLVSLLCAKKPEDLKLIIIDPKQIEFTAYEKIAHLLFPVVTDPRKALPIFKWLVTQMEMRYEQMAEFGVRNIFEYQELQQQRSDLEDMPFIVVMIDELADLMMTTGKDIEGLIARLAQMSRAAGIHMIVATQRPSVDVITGLIKVNFPNRISFKVTSKVDSRTILDEVGAERLLGKGDMLFIDAKDPHIRRVHGAYVSDKEIQYLVRHVESQQTVQFLDVSEFLTQQDYSEQLLDNDQELYQQVVDMLQDCDEVSISMIQRRFRIGFNRSARIIETLEARGLIMSSDGGKMRRVVKN